MPSQPKWSTVIATVNVPAIVTAASAVRPTANATTDACRSPTLRASVELNGAWSASPPPNAVASTIATPRSISASLRGQPVGPDPGVDGQRRVEVGRPDHLRRHELRGALR